MSTSANTDYTNGIPHPGLVFYAQVVVFIDHEIVSEYYQEIPHTYTTDQPTAP